MSLKWLVEETVTQGLNDLQERVSGEMENVLNEMASAATGYYEDTTASIPRRMSTTFNPFLYISGQMPENREVNISQGQSEILVRYSGMGLEEELGSDAKIWWEFAKGQEADPYERELERDYAFFQETGSDPIAAPSGAKHKYAIQRGLHASTRQIHDCAEREWKLMLERI